MATEREIFLDLVDQHGAAVLALLRRLCCNPHDADDVFQDVAIRVWRNLHSKPLLRNAKSWLMTIAYRAFFDHKSRRPVHAPIQEDNLMAQGDYGADPLDLAERAESHRLLDEHVAKLSPGIREVIALHYTGGLSLREVADTMQISLGTVKSRLNAGLEQLRRCVP